MNTDAEPPRPPRRKRYSGRNPRRYEDKYKEHDPSRHPETVAKVIASGKTPAGSHIPIMVESCLEALRPSPGCIGIDATLGFGGHASHLLPAILPGGRLIGLDQDPVELPKTIRRLRDAGFGEECFTAVRSNYAGIAKVIAGLQLPGADFVFADLGCSSMQFDDPSRGFSFKHDGPLDMRMNPAKGLPASGWIARTTPEKLAAALVDNADEPRAGIIAAALAGKEFHSTLEFADAIRRFLPPLPEDAVDLTIRRVFQAVRIVVNEEFTALDAFLRALPTCLLPGGRAAILTFHSGEDRRVKKSFQAALKTGLYSAISDGVLTPSYSEIHANPRSKPAKLRWAVRSD